MAIVAVSAITAAPTAAALAFLNGCMLSKTASVAIKRGSRLENFLRRCKEMDAVERAKKKAARREAKRPKKTKGQKQKAEMVVHGRPQTRRELDRATFRVLTER